MLLVVPSDSTTTSAHTANKGKKIYTTQYDHMIGAGKTAKKMKDSNATVTCPKK
ncbi:MAG TPA: hypothetical protein VF403_08305 [Kofleriaceae bacterium]